MCGFLKDFGHIYNLHTKLGAYFTELAYSPYPYFQDLAFQVTLIFKYGYLEKQKEYANFPFLPLMLQIEKKPAPTTTNLDEPTHFKVM